MTPEVTIQQLIDWGRSALSQGPSDSHLESRLLLSHCLRVDPAYLYTWPERTIPTEQQQAFRAMIQQRQCGVPIAYLTGTRPFWNFNLKVTPDVLIPRQETEVLVEVALSKIKTESSVKIADLGTGSGAIAIAIASERPQSTVIATDLSIRSLAVAQENAASLEIENIHFRQGFWIKALHNDKVHLILANPPYIATDDPHLKQGDLLSEPQGALISAGPTGLEDLKMIIEAAPNALLKDGWLMVEHGFQQGESVRRLFRERGFIDIRTFLDLSQHERVTIGHLIS